MKIDCHTHIGKVFNLKKITHQEYIAEEAEKNIAVYKKSGIDALISCYTDYKLFEDFRVKAAEQGLKVYGLQWLSLIEKLPEHFDYEDKEDVIGIKVHDIRNYRNGNGTKHPYKDSNVYRKILERNVPYIQHHFEVSSGSSSPLDLKPFVEKYPNTIFHICHLGQTYFRHFESEKKPEPYQAFLQRLKETDEMLAYPNVYTDCSFGFSSVKLAKHLALMQHPDKVVYATDYSYRAYYKNSESYIGWNNKIYELVKEQTEKYLKLLTENKKT